MARFATSNKRRETSCPHSGNSLGVSACASGRGLEPTPRLAPRHQNQVAQPESCTIHTVNTHRTPPLDRDSCTQPSAKWRLHAQQFVALLPRTIWSAQNPTTCTGGSNALDNLLAASSRGDTVNASSRASPGLWRPCAWSVGPPPRPKGQLTPWAVRIRTNTWRKRPVSLP